jgi:spore coat polysaccharide biosynthesis predicted glycosyltransferase SpsG
MNIDYDWLFVCDGNKRCGLGHVSRCLGYAEMLSDTGLLCTFWGNFDPCAVGMIDSAAIAIQPSGGITEDLSKLTARPLPSMGVLLDSYDADSQVINTLQSWLGLKRKLVVLDDFATYPCYNCRSVINFTAGAEQLRYPEGSFAKYLGPKFFPARRWLRTLRTRVRKRQPSGRIRRVLVAPGSYDAGEIVSTFVSLLDYIGVSVEIVVVTNDDSACSYVRAKHPKTRQTSLTFVPGKPDLGALLEWADVCFGGGGLIKYECLYAGLPIVTLAQNRGQSEDSKSLAALGVAVDLGLASGMCFQKSADLLERFFRDAEWQREMVNRGRCLTATDSGMVAMRPFMD